MKKILAVILSAVMLTASVSGCGGSNSSGGGGGDADKTYNLRLATHYPEGHPGLDAANRIKDALAEKSGGKIQVTVYPSSQLGDYTLTYEELMKGSIDMAIISIPSTYDTKLEMNFIPYMLSEYSQLEKAFGKDSYFFKEYTEVHKNLDVKLLGIYVEGFIGFGLKSLDGKYADPTANKSGLIRCPNIEVYKLATEDMGYSTTTIPYADLYSALQTGVCDGWIGGTPQLNYTGFRDVIKHYVPYNVFAENIGMFMSQKVFDGMPAEYQALIEEVFMDEAIRSYTDAEVNDLKAIEDMKAYDIEIVELTADQRNAIAEHVRATTWPKLEANIGKDVLDGLVEDLAK